MIEAIRNWFYKKGLTAQKRRALFELEQDLRYIREFKGTMLKYDEGKARKKMAELKRNENRNENEDAELEQVENVIAESKAVKNEYRRTSQVAEDVKNYLKLLR